MIRRRGRKLILRFNPPIRLCSSLSPVRTHSSHRPEFYRDISAIVSIINFSEDRFSVDEFAHAVNNTPQQSQRGKKRSSDFIVRINRQLEPAITGHGALSDIVG